MKVKDHEDTYNMIKVICSDVTLSTTRTIDLVYVNIIICLNANLHQTDSVILSAKDGNKSIGVQRNTKLNHFTTKQPKIHTLSCTQIIHLYIHKYIYISVYIYMHTVYHIMLTNHFSAIIHQYRRSSQNVKSLLQSRREPGLHTTPMKCSEMPRFLVIPCARLFPAGRKVV